MDEAVLLSAELLEAFARLTGDYSSVHMDAEFARRTQFRGRIAHGLLPVACLLASHSPQVHGRPAWLKHLSCRFVLPLRIGDSVYFAVERSLEAGQEVLDFKILKGEERVAVTTGRALFHTGTALDKGADSRPENGREQEVLLVEPLQEAAWLIGDLQSGHEERFAFNAARAAIQHFLNSSGPASGAAAGKAADGALASCDTNLSAVLVASSLIGMRLPGRFATFLECHMDFEEGLSDQAAASLCGTVSKLSPSGRLGVDLLWHQGAAVKGRGTAVALVGEPLDDAISCAEIKRAHAGFHFQKRIALVTGASRGIGAATAKLLALQGARVVVHFFQGRLDAEEVVRDIRECSGEAIAIGADLRQDDEVDILFKRIADEWGPVDILVNNAVGDFSPKAVERLSSNDYLAELEVTLFGAHACCLRALPGMKAQGRGKIINMGTIATEVPVASQSKYVTAKSALVGYTRSLALELASHNIQVNMVVPAMTMTSLIAALPKSLVDRMAEDCATGKLLLPVEVAKVIAFLASDWSSPITGQQIVLNQGMPPFL